MLITKFILLKNLLKVNVCFIQKILATYRLLKCLKSVDNVDKISIFYQYALKAIK